MAVYLTSIAYHGVMIAVLARYIFAPGMVLTEVLLAATRCISYSAPIFAAIFGVIVWLEPGAFVSSVGRTCGGSNYSTIPT